MTGKSMESLKKILIVDDEVDFAEALGFLLAEYSFSVDWAFSAEEAIVRLEKNQFDYVISDYFMPGLNGQQLFNFAQSHQKKCPPFIILSGNVHSINPDRFKGHLLSIFPKTAHYYEIIKRIQRDVDSHQ